jgi:DNA-binding transcriptional ArsR family regulator
MNRTDALALVTAVTVTGTLVVLAPAAASPPFPGDQRASAATAPPTPEVGTVLSEPATTFVTAVDDGPAEWPEVVVAVGAGYSRWDDSDPLHHETRRDLHRSVVASPGISLSALVERTDTNRSTLRYHCRVLEREDLVETATRHGQRRFYPDPGWSGEALDHDPALSAALRDDTLRAVLRAVYRTEPVSVGELAAELDCASSTVSYHLGRLEDDGLVDRHRDGRSVRTSLTTPVRQRLAVSHDGEERSRA